ncbi:hypothetical protein [Nostoc sp.]|uniref:hypothetical protein n=1 Tax=Nostoc sp. TaxID=1180 RepID=UPI002FF4BFEA
MINLVQYSITNFPAAFIRQHFKPKEINQVYLLKYNVYFNLFLQRLGATLRCNHVSAEPKGVSVGSYRNSQ